MKVTKIREYADDDSTQTLRIISGETFEGSIVTERLSTDKESGETITHFTLESPSLDRQVYRTLESLAAEVDMPLIDELTFEDPASDALELELVGSN